MPPVFSSATDANAYATTHPGMFPLATTWNDLAETIARFNSCGAHRGVADAERLPGLDAPQYARACTNPDAVLNTARHLFFHVKCGIYVAVQNGRVAAFVPFANERFRNTWHRRVVFPCGARNVQEYAEAKARATRRRPEALLPLNRWWLNGGIVCNWVPTNGVVWGEGYLAGLRAMLEAAVGAGGPLLPDAQFFINKRDYPVLRRDGLPPYARFVGVDNDDEGVASAFAPVFSFYVGSNAADIAMPTTEDWATASGQCLPLCASGEMDVAAWAAVRDAHPLASCAPVAVFRGSATHDMRVALARLTAAGSRVVDARLTSLNLGRDRVAFDPATGAVSVTFVEARDAPPTAPFLPLVDQVKQFRYLIYCDGHCAASRYGTLMHTGRVILRLASSQATDCGELWLFPGLVGARLGDADAVWQAADHVLIAPDASDLEAAIHWLNAQPVMVAERIAHNAITRAPCVHDIVGFWRRAIAAVGVHATTPMAAPPAKPWWGVADSRYAALPPM